MSRTKELLKNIGFLTISSIGIKIINFFLIPLYTSILTTEEYGQYDLFNTTISLLIPFLTLNIRESTVRYALSKEYEKSQIFTISIKYIMLSTFYFGIFLAVNYVFKISPLINEYRWLILLMFISQVINGVIVNFTRGLDRLKDVAVSSFICAIVIICLNLITLLMLKWGLTGYFVANIVGPMVQSIYLFVIFKGWKYIEIRSVECKVEKEMVSYSKPLVLNSTAWWINSVSDRYIVIWICGVAANGIYSVASKIPTILDMFQNIFSQAWTLSAVKEFDPADKDGFFTNMFNTYNMCMTIMCSGLIMISRILAKLLYSNDFYEAWKYVPFLLLAVLFGALAGYIGAIFAAIKDSKMFAQSTIIGAGINIVLNLIFIKPLGPIGAAVSTAICYWVIYWTRLVRVRKHIIIRMKLERDLFTYLLMVIQSIVLLIITKECMALYMMQMCILGLIVFLYKDTLLMLKHKLNISNLNFIK